MVSICPPLYGKPSPQAVLVSQQPLPCRLRRRCGGGAGAWIAFTLRYAWPRMHETDPLHDHPVLVLEAWLGAQQGKDVLRKCPGTCCNTRRLQLPTHHTSNHVSLLGREDGGSSENLPSCR